MAIIKCKECGSAISSQAGACPSCGAKRRKTSTLTWIFATLVGVPFLYGMISSQLRSQRIPTPSATVAAATERDAEGDARVQCRMAIKAAAVNPSTVKISMPTSKRHEGQWVFYWPLGSGLRMQNRLGAMNDAVALCVVKNGRIVKLTIDDTHVI
jgi:hypothetical protein